MPKWFENNQSSYKLSDYRAKTDSNIKFGYVSTKIEIAFQVVLFHTPILLKNRCQN